MWFACCRQTRSCAERGLPASPSSMDRRSCQRTWLQKVIEMSGLRPGQDIKIRFVSMRPGEKLHEELWSDSAAVNPTSFPSVLRIEPSPQPADFHEQLVMLEAAALKRDDEQARQMDVGNADRLRRVLRAATA